MATGNFQTSVEIGDKGEDVIENLMRKQGLNFIRTKNFKYEQKGLNFEADYYIKDENRFVEAKSLGGHCPTFCIEKYKNKENPYWNPQKGRYMGLDNQNDVKYPGWIRTVLAGQNLQIYIVNRKESTVYIYNAESLYKYVLNFPDGALQVAKDGNPDDSGWLVTVNWNCKEAGFINKISYNKRSA